MVTDHGSTDDDVAATGVVLVVVVVVLVIIVVVIIIVVVVVVMTGGDGARALSFFSCNVPYCIPCIHFSEQPYPDSSPSWETVDVALEKRMQFRWQAHVPHD
jgi:hypothetical protein